MWNAGAGRGPSTDLIFTSVRRRNVMVNIRTVTRLEIEPEYRIYILDSIDGEVTPFLSYLASFVREDVLVTA